MIELIDIAPGGVMAAVETVEDTTGIFDDYRMLYRPVPGRPREMYAPWGVDNELPYKIRDLVGSDEVTAQNKFFNVLACYGAGPVLNGADGTRCNPFQEAHRAGHFLPGADNRHEILFYGGISYNPI